MVVDTAGSFLVASKTVMFPLAVAAFLPCQYPYGWTISVIMFVHES